MKNIAIIAALATACFSAPALAREPNMVCLVTFGSVKDAVAGANTTALSGEYMSSEEAVVAAYVSDGLANFWDYSGIYKTNAEEEAFCEGPTFNPGNKNSAKKFAPGQLKGDGESAKEFAPGQQDGGAKDSAPGQKKKP